MHLFSNGGATWVLLWSPKLKLMPLSLSARPSPLTIQSTDFTAVLQLRRLLRNSTFSSLPLVFLSLTDSIEIKFLIIPQFWRLHLNDDSCSASLNLFQETQYWFLPGVFLKVKDMTSSRFTWKHITYHTGQEQTVAVIKPDMMDQKEEILRSIEEAGIVIQAQKTVTLSKDEAGSFYDEHKNKEFYGDLCSYMARYEFVLTPYSSDMHPPWFYSEYVGPGLC